MAWNGVSSSPLYLHPLRSCPLTARQAEVLQLAAHGLSSKQIAHQLGISVRTVEDHFSAMGQRTGTHSKGELIAYGAAAGLVCAGVPCE
jgi:DNA-binding NarL/FixJ family response regulator